MFSWKHLSYNCYYTFFFKRIGHNVFICKIRATAATSELATLLNAVIILYLPHPDESFFIRQCLDQLWAFIVEDNKEKYKSYKADACLHGSATDPSFRRV